jgi:predicted dehydrogenase
MSDMKQGVLIHGAGWVATQHVEAFLNDSRAEIVAISSRTTDSAHRLAEKYELEVPCYGSLREGLGREGVDIVSICTPQHVHVENALDIAAAGKHLVIEKPAAMNLAQLRQVQAAVDRTGVKSIVSFVLRWNPLFQAIKRMSSQGALGEIFCVETDYQSYQGDWWPGWEQGRTVAKGGSAMMVAGCHAVDALRWFAGAGEFEAANPVEVFAWTGGKRKGRTEMYDPTTHGFDTGTPLEYDGLEIILVRFDNGVLGKVSCNFECVQPYSFPIEVFGNQGTIKGNKVYSHWFPKQRDWVELPVITPDSSDVSDHPFQGQMSHFLDCIEQDVESHCNLAQAAISHEIVFAAEQCRRTGLPVKWPLEG